MLLVSANRKYKLQMYEEISSLELLFMPLTTCLIMYYVCFHNITQLLRFTWEGICFLHTCSTQYEV